MAEFSVAARRGKGLLVQKAGDDGLIPNSHFLQPQDFVRKWGPQGSASRLNERAGAQAHFIDLCRVLNLAEPDDPDSYCFERGFKGIKGSSRFADVWKRGCFAWEYKAPGGDLKAALSQLMQYALPLENPPLLIVSDRLRIEINTHFTGCPSTRIEITNGDLRDRRNLELIRAVFSDPMSFRPEKSASDVTAELASTFAAIADGLRDRGVSALKAAHFLTQCLFSFFAEDAGVLENNIFKRMIKKRQEPLALQRGLTDLFKTMKTGGDFGVEEIPWINGGLFAVVDVPKLSKDEISTLMRVADSDWRAIDASIFGTLFERGLDPAKRSQLGAHYTDATTIQRLVDPIVRRPLTAEWDRTKRKISGLLSDRDVLRVRAKGIPSTTDTLQQRRSRLRSQANRADRAAQDLFSTFLEHLKNFRILDPACGSGNFLYLALKALKDVELQANIDAEELGLGRQLPVTGPQNVLGIEMNEYAAELARATIWIGELQWLQQNGYGWKTNPVLDPLDQIECRDALLNPDMSEAVWPSANVVLGNPPFLGGSKKRGGLGASYFEALGAVFDGRVPPGADLVCYWFEKARWLVEKKGTGAVGMVATNSIRGGVNRTVLSSICRSTRITEAWSDQEWINEGAAVRVSLICFGGLPGTTLDGRSVSAINSDLTSTEDVDLTGAKPLAANSGAAYLGMKKGGGFEIEGRLAREWLSAPNPHGKTNADVLRRWTNGTDIVKNRQDKWIIDFGPAMPETSAQLYELPFRHVLNFVKPVRDQNNREIRRRYWWRFSETMPALRAALDDLDRFIVTPRVSKHRVFAWRDALTVPDDGIGIVCRADDTTFGILHSRFHELWSLRMCTWLGKGNDPRYTPTTCFETFPFPPGLSPVDTASKQLEVLSTGEILPAGLPNDELRAHAANIARAARHLTDLRDRWLHPPEWTYREPEVAPASEKRSSYSDRVLPREGFEKRLAQRTLTNLYNERPSWLIQAHEVLCTAVAAAYGWADWSSSMSDEEILSRLLLLNREMGARTVPPMLAS